MIFMCQNVATKGMAAMDKKWRETFLAYSTLDECKKKVTKTQEAIRHVIAEYNQPYVAFSGGKDSTCIAHMCIQINPDIMIFHWDYGRYYIPRDIHAEIINNVRKMGAKNIRIETSPLYDKLGRKAINVLGREMIEKLIPKLKTEGYDACLVGLRAEESLKRKRRIKSNRSLSAIKEFFPIADWTWMDVWAYIVSHDIPYLSLYDRYAPVLGWDKARFTTLFDPEFDKLGASNIDGVLSWRYRYHVD